MAGEYKDIIELLISELGKLGQNAQYVRRSKRLIIQKTIQDYLTRLSQKEQELLSLIQTKYQDISNENRINQLLNSMSEEGLTSYLTEASTALKEQIKVQQEEKCYADLKALFITGYRLVMTLREYFLNESIQYEVASEKGNFSFEVGEEEFLAQSRASLSSLSLAIQNGQINIDFVQKITIGSTLKNKAEASGYKIYDNLSGQDGSTFWSRGKRILKALQAEKELSGGSHGLNFGHFYEAYMHFNGNGINFTRGEQPNNIRYAAAMLALRNPTKFYEGGDIGNIQLKTNEATITHISTIRKCLEDILRILTTQKNARKQFEQIRQGFKNSGAETSIESLMIEKENEIIKYFLNKSPDAINIFLGL